MIFSTRHEEELVAKIGKCFFSSRLRFINGFLECTEMFIPVE